ncbi:MAG: sporulation transcriptional regulator SpoIIID [Clostridiales bacterium]|nr:sporulation transcriptional regulator SpoIIID [Clostridiales bacterium]
MKSYICERVLEIADYVIEHKCTVREVAHIFCVSKSTAHKDLSERLPVIDKQRYSHIEQVLTNNWDVRYLRGGEATKRKYKG